MELTEQQIAETVERLARGEFDPAVDWPVCYGLVRSEVARRNLPAKDFAPSGGSNWMAEDFQELSGEWIAVSQGERARRLSSIGRSAAHVANSVRRSIYHFVLDQGRSNPQRDLWAALKETLIEFPALTKGESRDVPVPPDLPFPWQQESFRSQRRRRFVTAPEVRAALGMVEKLKPVGWSLESLFKYLSEWSGVVATGEQSLDAMDYFDEPASRVNTAGADSAMLGREAARLLLRQLDASEQTILRGFIIPNGLGTIGLEDAARSVGLSKSTLHDRAGRLREKLASAEFGELVTMDADARRAFLEELLREAGRTAGDGSIT